MWCISIFDVVAIMNHSLRSSYLRRSYWLKGSQSKLTSYCRKLNRMLGLFFFFPVTQYFHREFLETTFPPKARNRLLHWTSKFLIEQKGAETLEPGAQGRFLEPVVYCVPDKFSEVDVCSASVQSQWSSTLLPWLPFFPPLHSFLF